MSPLFILEGERQYKPKRINFTADRKVHQVQAEDGRNFVKRITFLDEAGEQISSYNPTNYTRGGKIYQIEEGEELIGVYGDYGEQTGQWCFQSFGFIVKLK